MATARTIGGPDYPKMIEEIERELNSIVEDFDRAVHVEALRLANKRGKLSFLNLLMVDPQEFGAEQERAERERLQRQRAEQKRTEKEPADQERTDQEPADQERTHQEPADQERTEHEPADQGRTEQEPVKLEGAEQDPVEHEFLFKRLNPVQTGGYHPRLRCMDGTRQALLNHIVDWVAKQSGQENVQRRNTYWIYGSPGIGKTSVAHSICANLDERNHLAGAFFCRRDDPVLSKPINILPTIIHKLAMIFPPLGTVVAKHLHDHTKLSPESTSGPLFLDFIRSLPHHPNHTLVFVIDAFDECGDDRSRPRLLRVLTDAAAHAPWLKIIITSRADVDIQRFFDTLPQASYLSCDLATDHDASADLRTFARNQFDSVASHWHLATPWPKESDFDRVICRANGLFIFVKTLALALERCEDPEEVLEAAMQESVGSGLESLYDLYSVILKVQIVDNNDEFQRMIGVLLTATPNRALCDETIGELAEVKPSLVKKWVDALSSLLYRDEGADRCIRVRHLSVYNFFVCDLCNYQVNIRYAGVQLGIACLRVMNMQLRFNICRLEDSRLANADIEDLPSRVKQNISDALQYSCLHWLDHLRFPSDTRDQCVLVLESLKKFFEGLYPLFWVEVLSVMGMIPVGAPGIRRLLSWVRVSTSSAPC